MEEMLKQQQKISKWVSRARHQDSGHYGKGHIDASLDDMSQGHIIN